MGLAMDLLEAQAGRLGAALQGLDRQPPKVAVIGTEGSGKTVFIATLAHRLCEVEPAWLLDPVDMPTQAYVTKVWETLRGGEWPSFTVQATRHELRWNLRRPDGPAAELQVVDASGHRLRELFTGDTKEIPEHLRPLAEYCQGADLVILLINLQDFLGEAAGEQRTYNEMALKFALDFVGARDAEKRCCAIFTQVDRYEHLAATHGNWNEVARVVVPKLWGAHFQKDALPIFGVSAVDGTEIRPDEQGLPRRFPAPDFKSTGFEPFLGWVRETLAELETQHTRRDVWYRLRNLAMPVAAFAGCLFVLMVLWNWWHRHDAKPTSPKIVVLERFSTRTSEGRTLVLEGIKPVWRYHYRFELFVKFRNDGADGKAVVFAHYRKGDYEGRPSTPPFEILHGWEYTRSFFTDVIDAEELDVKTIDVEAFKR